ncbi:MAG: hypothetical protein HEQ34_13125 [Sphingorhabdus sp.]|uniref:hypothetical protein n=1 Tax=Sphingorhabdus sp. TaxID=1902408 RepID=UPI0025D38DE9|nr:hypothetical protein [Sphingorhabdus sp.]MCO4092875.1 hypothetical protein [Sphingorhabdus sp.]
MVRTSEEFKTHWSPQKAFTDYSDDLPDNQPSSVNNPAKQAVNHPAAYGEQQDGKLQIDQVWAFHLRKMARRFPEGKTNFLTGLPLSLPLAFGCPPTSPRSTGTFARGIDILLQQFSLHNHTIAKIKALK